MLGSKTANLRKRLERGAMLSSLDIWRKCGIYRGADAIFKLRRRGMDIETVMLSTGGQMYAAYRIVKRKAMSQARRK